MILVDLNEFGIPELTDFEHECLRALVATYGWGDIAALAHAIAADMAEEEESV